MADPATLAGATIYLPTRRAARMLGALLLRRSSARALLMPRIVPLGDPLEAEMGDILASAGGTELDGEAIADIQPVAPLARRMLLARQLLHAARSGALLPAAHLGAAFALAGDLAAILDAMQAEDIPPEKLAVLDAARFDVYWQHSASALAVIGEHWPALLAARGEADPVAWRNKLLERQRRRLMEVAPAGPVMVVGSTGSLPATAKLIGAVARLKAGAVILPDLDFSLSDGLGSGSARARRICATGPPRIRRRSSPACSPPSARAARW